MRGQSFSIRQAARRWRTRRGAPGAAAGVAPTGFALTPALHYRVSTGASVTTQTVAAVPANVQAATAVIDLRGLADATNALGTGPMVLTDAHGRRFLRFTNASGSGTNGDGPNGPNLRHVGNAFGAAPQGGRDDVFSLGTAGASPPKTGGGVLRTVAQSAGGAIMSRCGNRPATGASANVAALFTGTQLQVLGCSPRATAGTGANQGQRLSVNALAGNVDRTSTALSGSGATIGSNAFTPGATD